MEVIKIALFFRDLILPMFGLKTYRMKFSGRKGIHITIPNESFATCFGPTEHIAAYPIVPLRTTEFFSTMIPPTSLRKLKLDLALYNPRRLLRCAYSLHLESNLVAAPIWPEELEGFRPEKDAEPSHVQVDDEWLHPKATFGEGSLLLEKVAQWLQLKHKLQSFLMSGKNTPISRTVRPRQVMPCIQNLLAHGFKTQGYRNLVLFNVIQAIKRFNLPINHELLIETNAKSSCPLPEHEIRTMIRYHFEKKVDSSYFFNCRIMQQAGFCPSEGCRLGRIK